MADSTSLHHLQHVSVVAFVFDFACVFEFALFLKLLCVCPNVNVLGDCSVFALVVHHISQLTPELCTVAVPIACIWGLMAHNAPLF